MLRQLTFFGIKGEKFAISASVRGYAGKDL